jgi:hypothetical protein
MVKWATNFNTILEFQAYYKVESSACPYGAFTLDVKSSVQ